jgi:leader peptidase (prepilin peptidase)/N-methyltransferase
MTAATGAYPAAVTAAFVTGLVVGSFLNVVIYRAPRRISVASPGSFCPTCETPIRGYDNVPLVSWLVLRGRCRRCGTPISARYPAVELATGVLFGLLAWVLGPHWAVPGVCTLAGTLLVVALIEFDGMLAPAGVALFGSALGVSLLTAAAVADQRWWRLGGMLIGVGAAAGVATLAARVSNGPARAAKAPWGLLPAGALFGWLGPIGSGVGTVLTLGVLVAEHRLRTASTSGVKRKDLGVGVAAAAGGVAAVISSWIAGNLVGL